MSWKACVSQNVLSLLCSRVCVVSARWLTAVKSPRLQRVPSQRLSDSCLHPCCCCWCWWWGQREGGKKKGDLLPPRTPHNASTRWLFICWRMWRDGAGAGQCDIKWWWGSGTVAARTAGARHCVPWMSEALNYAEVLASAAKSRSEKRDGLSFSFCIVSQYELTTLQVVIVCVRERRNQPPRNSVKPSFATAII